MVSDNPSGDLLISITHVMFQKFRCFSHQRLKQVGVVVRDDALENTRDAFQPHAGINAGHRQGREGAAGVAVELHEDEVPDFDVAATVTGKFAIRVPFVRSRGAHVVMNLAAWPARAGVTHGPEVVLESCDSVDAFLWHSFA